MNTNKKTNRLQHHCLIIGSFRKHYKEILKVIDIFHNSGITVLSPKKSFVINPEDEFVLFDYDPKNKSKKEIEDAVLEKIRNVDFVYLANFNGYIGPSASFEVGYCHAHKIKVFALEPSEEICTEYIDDIKTPEEVVQLIKDQQLGSAI